jgi:DNA-directed RNA polymerase specialized sigma24 family protein
MAETFEIVPPTLAEVRCRTQPEINHPPPRQHEMIRIYAVTLGRPGGVLTSTVMSKAARPTLVAILGAASLTLGAQVAQADSRAPAPAQSIQHSIQYQAQEQGPQPGNSLRELIDARLDKASTSSRHEEIDQLTTLWMTLNQRDQLDRVVERGDGFLNVALRNQRYSEHRSDARYRRAAFASGNEQAVIGQWGSSFQSIEEVEQRLDVERFVGGLGAPYRDAVSLSLTGMNHREVAEELGVSHAATRKWAQRLRERLAEEPELLDS